MIILSGHEGPEINFAGVGFLVAPWACDAIVGFCQFNERMASIKLKIPGGEATVVSIYAPPNTPNHPYEERHDFFATAAEFVVDLRTHGG